MAIRNIMNYKTDDILRKKSKTIEKLDGRILSILDDMAETMYHANGAGLSAVQVGILKRLVVMGRCLEPNWQTAWRFELSTSFGWHDRLFKII